MHCIKPLPLVLAVASLFSYSAATYADNTAQALPFAQNWSDTSLVAANDVWSNVPGIIR